MQSIWLIIIVFFLLLIVMPITTKLHASFDVLHNIGTVSLYVFFVKIFAYKVRLKNKKIVLYTKKNNKEVETEVSSKQMRFLEQMNAQLKQKFIVKQLAAYSKIGTGDAMQSAVLTGLFRSAACSFFAYIKNKKKSAKFKVISEPAYNGTFAMFSLYGKLSITLMDILYSLIMAAIIIKRSEKYERV